MTGVFISYRREDTAGWAGRLAEALRRELPANDIFYDIGSIEIGEDFVDVMRRSLASCSVVIVVIGPRWLSATDDAGRRRLNDPEDWVRLEVVESLHRPELRVIPVLVGAARMPRRTDLPEQLKPLARRNAHEVTDNRWDYDVTQLVAALRRVPSLASTPARAGSTGASSVRAARTTAEMHALASPAELRPGTAFHDGTDGPEMVIIPAGEFLMGSPPGEEGREPDEGPQHRVTIAPAFAVGKHAVTFDEWDACVATGACARRASDKDWGRGRRPVIDVSWEDAQAYVQWLSKRTGKTYRLLSEAEWEYAARAGTSTRYPWGDEPGAGHANFRDSGSEWSAQRPAPVGSFEPNRFGLHDMIGNVWEWVQDCWNDTYRGGPSDGSAWESNDCGRRVVRGGSWNSRPGGARTANRGKDEPRGRGDDLGFRLARTL